MNDFYDKMSGILEVAATSDTRFREVEGWSSLMGFAILVTLENDYGVRMTLDEFATMHTIGDLESAITR